MLTVIELTRANPVVATVAAVLLMIVGILVIIYPGLLAWIAGIGLVLRASRSLSPCTSRRQVRRSMTRPQDGARQRVDHHQVVASKNGRRLFRVARVRPDPRERKRANGDHLSLRSVGHVAGRKGSTAQHVCAIVIRMRA